jgi:hypothetical protein
MSGMRLKSQDGAINALVLPLVLAVLLLIGAAVFGAWAYSGRQDYKNNVDKKIAAAVVLAKQDEDKVKDAQFAEENKRPLKTYTGPSAYGSIAIQYPKTWSAYVSDTGSDDPYVDGYFAPNAVPDAQDPNSNFALRVQVSATSYNDTMQQFQDNEGTVTVQPYALPKVPKVVGAIVTGAIEEGKTGTMVILPLRNTTLKLWTESPSFKSDFNNIILPNASFSP